MKHYTRLLTNSDDPFLASLQATSALVAPLYGARESPFGFLVVESGVLPKGENLIHVSDFVSAVSKQLSLAFEFKEDRRSDAARWEILRAILANDLKPSVGFAVVCRQLTSFLPQFTKCTISPSPQCQILLYVKEDDFLTVVATTGQEPLNTRVLLDRSVTGRLIKEDKRLLLSDPRMDPLYRPYLGSEMKSELALSLALSDTVTAILNFESENEEAFREIHVTALRVAAHHLTPVLAGLHARHDRNLLQQRAVLYALDKHLSDVTAAFTHDVNGPLSTARVLVDEIAQGASTDANESLAVAATALLDSIVTVDTLRTQLQTDIVGFSHHKRRNVAALMRAAVQLVRPKQLRKRNIVIVEDVDETAEVDSSLFLKEVFSNLLMNAKYWIAERQSEAPNYGGRIDIIIAREQREDALGNTEPGLNEKVRIVVRDNGPGMHPKYLDNVFEEHFTHRKGGTGYGLFAAKEYVSSIGGEIKAATEEGIYFEVTIVLDEYSSRGRIADDTASVFAPDTLRLHSIEADR